MGGGGERELEKELCVRGGKRAGALSFNLDILGATTFSVHA
jgi:hypothetical protein